MLHTYIFDKDIAQYSVRGSNYLESYGEHHYIVKGIYASDLIMTTDGSLQSGDNALSNTNDYELFCQYPGWAVQTLLKYA